MLELGYRCRKVVVYFFNALRENMPRIVFRHHNQHISNSIDQYLMSAKPELLRQPHRLTVSTLKNFCGYHRNLHCIYCNIYIVSRKGNCFQDGFWWVRTSLQEKSYSQRARWLQSPTTITQYSHRTPPRSIRLKHQPVCPALACPRGNRKVDERLRRQRMLRAPDLVFHQRQVADERDRRGGSGVPDRGGIL